MKQYYKLLHEVVYFEVGYANGHIVNPLYHDVKTGLSGFAKTVHASYDPSSVSLRFYRAIDPTLLNHQGEDVGTQYRSGVFYSDVADREGIEKFFAEKQKSLATKIPIEVLPLSYFNFTEECHQDYLDMNPCGYCHLPASLFEFASRAKDPSIS